MNLSSFWFWCERKNWETHFDGNFVDFYLFCIKFISNLVLISFRLTGCLAKLIDWRIFTYFHIGKRFFFNMQAINCVIIFRYCKAKCHLQQRYHVIANKVHFHLITMSHVVDCELQNYTLNHFQYTCMREIWNFPEDFRGHVASLVIEIRLKNSFCRRFSIMQYWPIF